MVTEDSDYADIAAEAMAKVANGNQRVESYDQCVQRVIDRYKAGG